MSAMMTMWSWLLAAVVGTCAVCVEAATPETNPTKALSCYRTVDASPGTSVATTFVLVDTTTPLDKPASDSLDGLVRRILSHRGERVIAMRFAGLATGEYPNEFARAYQEPVPSEQFRKARVIADVERLEKCLPRLWARNIAGVPRLTRQQLGSTPEGEYSEIVFAYQWLVTEVMPSIAKEGPVRVVVYSDGFEHSRSGRSFYRNRLPRIVDPERELKAVKGELAARQAEIKPVPHMLYWVGMGVLPAERRHYLTPEHLHSLKAFWTKVAAEFGANDPYMGSTLPPEVVK